MSVVHMSVIHVSMVQVNVVHVSVVHMCVVHVSVVHVYVVCVGVAHVSVIHGYVVCVRMVNMSVVSVSVLTCEHGRYMCTCECGACECDLHLEARVGHQLPSCIALHLTAVRQGLPLTCFLGFQDPPPSAPVIAV